MRSAKIFYKNKETGILKEHNKGNFTFEYTTLWLADKDKPAISLTLPKSEKVYQSDYLMPFFYNILPEGTNKKVICTNLKIEENDYFSLLCATQQDTVGAITVQEII